MTPIRLVLVEDHETVRAGLKMLIDSQPDMEVVGEAANGRTAIARIVAMRPAVVVMDVSMPEMNGLEATRELVALYPEMQILALSRYGDAAYVREMLAAGARGYVLKQSATNELLSAIRNVAAGVPYLDTALALRPGDVLKRSPRRPSSGPRITERETAVLRSMALGHSNKEIAAALNISVKTVEVHKANATRKLGLSGRIEVMRYAVLQGWLKDP